MITNINEVDSWLQSIENSTPDFLTPHFISTNYNNSPWRDLKVKKENQMRQEKVYHFVYKTTNLINHKIYIGKHSTNNLEDGYLGSGKHINYSIKKYGKENFKREILKHFETEQEAYNYEAEVVTKEFVLREDNYNYKQGGKGGTTGMVSVVDTSGNHFSIFKDDPRYISGELQHTTKGKMVVKDIDGYIFQISVDDPRYISGELVSVSTGRIFITNGKVDKCLNSEEEAIPVGFWRGTKNKGLKRVITNGQENRRIFLYEKVPEGFWIGSTAKGLVSITDGKINRRINLEVSDIPEGYRRGNSNHKGTLTVKNELGETSRVSIEEFYSNPLLSSLNKGVPSKNKSSICITNGFKNKYISPDEEIPNSWKKGSKPKATWILESPLSEKFYFYSKKETIAFCKEVQISYKLLEKNRNHRVKDITTTGRRIKNIPGTFNWKLIVMKVKL